MEKLSNPQNTIAVIKKYDFYFRKQFGQNFLIDAHVLERIITGAKLGPEDTVLEIGPGIGTMTQYLSEAAGKVIAVEIDKNLLPILEETLEGYDNIQVINADVLELDLCELVEKENDGRPVKVVANLPYYITTPIIMGLFERHVPLESITVMVQKEVAARMKAGPGSKDYGALSLAVQYYANPYIVANVPRNCFIPRPNVDSVVIRLTKFDNPPVTVRDEMLMFGLIRAAFEQRRKTLVNSLSGSAKLAISKEQAAEAVRRAGLPAQVRGEALTLAQFAQLADACSEVLAEKRGSENGDAGEEVTP